MIQKPNIKFLDRVTISLKDTVVTPEPGPTRMASPNRNTGTLGLFLFIFRVIKFSFSKKCRDPNPRPDPNGGSESEPDLLRRFHLSYQNILLCHFSLGFRFRGSILKW